MTLTPGTRVGPYDVVALLGTGGMGEVYRARDSKLNREVALKVLPEAFALDPDRLTRFRREAQVLAALNHPNIAAIHGLEDASGTPALALELVEGPTLADRIREGPIPIDEAVRIAEQIVEALAAAHEQGIVHRDLKPANIKLREDGSVKVLDFGLAKALEGEAGDVGRDFSPAGSQDPAYTHSPTLSLAATRVGVLLGTAAYMAPEQARGKPVDRRADIWAFGCVVYEMLTGKRAFEGEEISDTLAAILRAEPDWTPVPERMRRLLRACLEKDRKRRLQAIGDVRLLLDDTPATAAPVQRRNGAWMAATAVSTLIAGGVGLVHLTEQASPEPTRQMNVALPPDTDVGYLALSPDGGQILLGLSLEGGGGQLWRRSMSSSQLQLLTGTAFARTPFWSPDGRSIGFFSEGALKTMAASGGPSQILCANTGLGAGGSWNGAGEILFGTESGSIMRVHASGGSCDAVIETAGGRRYRLPTFLPDGRHFLYVASGGEDATRGLSVAALDDTTGRLLLRDASSAVFAPIEPGSRQGHLLFLRESTLMAAPFDSDSLVLNGEPIPVAEDATFSYTAGQVAAAASADGTLAYVSRPPRRLRLTWFDRSGEEIGELGSAEGENQRHVAFSPDEKMVATRRLSATGETAIWLYETGRGVATRFAGSPAGASVWSPDGGSIAYDSEGDLYVQTVGGGTRELLVDTDNPKAPSDWSAAARSIVYTEVDPASRADIWMVPGWTGGQRQQHAAAAPFLRTEFAESQARFSPDGRWIAYASDESGQTDIYVGAFPSGAGKVRISDAGGREPMWRRDGRELFYVQQAGTRARIVAVSLEGSAAERFTVGRAQVLFDYPTIVSVPQANLRVYSPDSDGTRFLVNMQASDSAPEVTVVTNWTQLLSGAARR